MSLQYLNRVISIELDKLLIALVLIAVLILVVKKIILALRTEGKIDERLRETRARISKAVTEIEEYKDRTTKVKQEQEQEVGAELELDHNTNYDRETLVQFKTEETKQLREYVKEKKTRAMSMEERWAEYDKKRSRRSSGTA